MIDFDWPKPFQPELGAKARQLHEIVQGQSWIREVAAASGGIGAGPSSSWIFWLENYAALDRLLRDQEDSVAQAYDAFFSAVPVMKEKVRQEVIFM
jgi:hypothetical protein